MRTLLKCLGYILTLTAIAAAPATAPTTAPAAVSASTGGPFMLLFIMIAVLLILVGIGIAIGALVIAAVAALMFLGIVSTSALVAMKDKRLESGARAFIVQLSVVLGIFGGGVIFCLVAFLTHLPWSLRADLAIGILCGAVSGIIVGLIVNAVWRRTQQWIVSRKAPVNASV